MVAPMHDAREEPSPPAAGETTAAALVRRLANGDTRAMEHFYELTCQQVYGLACRLLGDPLRAQSVLHDVYVDAWRRTRRDRPRVGTEISWILSLVFEHCPAPSSRTGRPSFAVPDPMS